MKESVLSLIEKTTQHWFSSYQSTRKYLTDPLNIIFYDVRDFGRI